MTHFSCRLFVYGFLVVLLILNLCLVNIETRVPVFFQGRLTQDDMLLAEQFQKNQFSRQYLIEITGQSSSANLTGFVQDMIQGLNALDPVERVWMSSEPPFDAHSIVSQYSKSAQHIYSLEPEHDAVNIFDPNRLANTVAQLKTNLLGPQGYLVRAVAKHDPLLLTFHALKNWRKRIAVRSSDIGQRSIIFLQSKPEAFDFNAQQQIQFQLDTLFHSLNARHGHQFQMRITGMPVFAVAAETEIKSDVQRVTILSSIGVILVFMVLLRSLKAMHWVMIILVSAMGVGILTTSLIFGMTHVLTIALGATLIGVCIDYPIHVMMHNAVQQTGDTLQTVSKIWPSLLLGGLTTMTGYCALAFTGYPGFQQIAVFAISGIATALLLTRYALPFLLDKTSIRVPWLPGVKALLTISQPVRKLSRLIVIALGTGSLVLFTQLEWMDGLEKLSGNALQQQKLIDASIRRQISTIESGRMILVKAATLEDALIRSEQTSRVLNNLVKQGLLEQYVSVYPWLVSQQLQHRNLQVFERFVNPEYQRLWQNQLSEHGLSVKKLGHLLDRQSEVLYPESVLQSKISELIEPQVISDDHSLIAIWLGKHQPNAVMNAIKQLNGVNYISQRDTIKKLAMNYRNTAIGALSAGLLIILLMLLLRYRHLIPAITVLLPAIFATLFIYGFWSLSKQEISFLHLIGSLLTVAICVDYGIYFFENRSQNQLHTYQAMAVSMLTTVVAFASLSISNNPVLQTLSVAVSVGVAVGFLLCPVLIPYKTTPR